MNAAERINDPAIGNEQFTLDRATFLRDRPSIGRTEPEPAELHMAQMRRDKNGSGCYNDLTTDPFGGWTDADSDLTYGTLWENTRP